MLYDIIIGYKRPVILKQELSCQQLYLMIKQQVLFTLTIWSVLTRLKCHKNCAHQKQTKTNNKREYWKWEQ